MSHGVEEEDKEEEEEEDKGRRKKEAEMYTCRACKASHEGQPRVTWRNVLALIKKHSMLMSHVRTDPNGFILTAHLPGEHQCQG